MGSDEVDGMERLPAIVLEEVRASANPGGEVPLLALVSLDEAAYRIAEDAVPFGPSGRSTRWKLSHQVAIRPGAVPRFCDKLCSLELGLICHLLDQQWIHGHLAIIPSCEGGGQIKPEAIHVHLVDPITQAFHDPVRAHGVVRIHGVAATCVVCVLAIAENVVAVLGNRRPAVPEMLTPRTLGGVVEDHVQDHLDALPVKLSHQRLEAHDRRADSVTRREALHRHEKVDCRVAPEVTQLFAVLRVLPGASSLIELVDWQQLHCIDPQLEQVGNLLDET
mmetsp:Transcript_100335/g.239220  ORF Transcript_100335/g.239220 Transcript_100335/m.239220 type:complete len:278 (-) Transcript_100335:693-1526(-)